MLNSVCEDRVVIVHLAYLANALRSVVTVVLSVDAVRKDHDWAA